MYQKDNYNSTYTVNHSKTILSCSEEKSYKNKSETFHVHERLHNRCQTKGKKPAARKNRSAECIVTPTITTTNDDPSHENDNDCRSTFVGIIQDKSNHSNSDNNTSKKQNNNDDQQHHEHTVSKRVHHEIGVVADFVSVSEKTGNTSSLSEEQLSNVDVTLYIPALFHLKKFISSQEELEWKGIIAKFFYKK